MGLKKKRVYISGAIIGLDYKHAQLMFLKASKRLRDLGFIPVNPMKENPFKEGKNWFEYMGEDIALLGTCSSIYMMRNWGGSDGACIEHEISVRKDISISYECESDEVIKQRVLG